MPFEEIYRRLAAIEKKLDFFDQLRPMLQSRENVCGKCINDVLTIANDQSKIRRLETKALTNEQEVFEIEKGQEPEKEINDENQEMNGDVSQVDDNCNEDKEAIVNTSESDNDLAFEYYKTFGLDPTKCTKKDSENSVVHILQAINAKLYFDKMRLTRRNLLDYLPPFDDFNSSTETNVANTSNASNYMDEPTAEEVFAIHPEFIDDDYDAYVIEDTPIKKQYEYEDTDEDFLKSFNVSDTFHSDDSDGNDGNDTTIIAADFDEQNK